MAIPAVVALAGGVLAALWRPSRQARSLIQHFAAGVILAALAVELMPEIAREHVSGPIIAIAFAVGSLAMYGLKLFTERLEASAEARDEGAGGVPRGLLFATFIDVAVDGFIIGAGFATGGDTGPVLAIGLSVELLFLGLALTSDAPGGARIIVISGSLGGVVLAAGVGGKLLLASASAEVMGATLSFSAAALLYLVTEELLMEAHVVPEKHSSTRLLVGGFLAFWVIQLSA